MKCRICGTSDDFYESALAGNWNHGVCKSCCKEEYARRAAKAKRDRETFTEDPDVKMHCPICSLTKHISAFAISVVAGGPLGFKIACMGCKTEERKTRAELRAETLEGLSAEDAPPFKCCMCKKHKTLADYRPSALTAWTKSFPCHCSDCKRKYDADLYAAKKAKKPAGPRRGFCKPLRDDYSDLV